MRKSLIFATLATALLAPVLAWAHPQHASTTTLLEGLMHPFLALDHVLAMVALGAWAAQLGSRAMWVLPAAFLIAMLAGGMLGLIGIQGTAAVQPLVAATVMMLGMLIIIRFRASLLEGALVAAAFAVFHGAAHIATAPATANLVAYGAGLMAATVLLNLVGIAAALAVRCRDNILRMAAAPVAFAGACLLVSRVT